MTSRSVLFLAAVALSAFGAACAVAPIGSGQQDDSDTGAAPSSTTKAKKDGGSELDPTPVAASTASCTNLKACASRVSGADATTFAKVAGEGDGDTCTKALAQCTSLLATSTPTVVDAGTTTPTTAGGCAALTTCCDALFDANNQDYKTCDTVVDKAVDASCNVSLSAFQNEGTCL